MKINTDEKKIVEILSRSIDTIYPNKEDFERALKSGKQLRIYMGIDPTATYVHLGHATNYLILKRLHELGHKIIVLVGDFTAMIGDPSDKNAARRRLTSKEVKENLRTFKKQISKILNFEDEKNPIEFCFNSEWLSKLSFSDILDLGSHLTVQRMLERDNFEKRIKEGKPLFVYEFFYPLLQGYDSVALKADVEIGGTDQTFNMLVGRTLVKTYQNREKIVITTTLLENPITGEKLMSKSLGTGIGLGDPADEMFGKTMALPDETIIQVFIDCTYLVLAEIEDLKRQLNDGANPRDLKLRLAYEIVKMYHSEKAAKKARENFIKIFSRKEKPADMPELKPTAYDIITILVESKICSSKGDARRQIAQGGVKVNDEKILTIDFKIKTGDVVQKGSRWFVRVF